MWCGLASVLVAVSFVMLLLSGAMLFVAPPGRVANWSNWRLLGLTKHDWGGLHIWFAAVPVRAAALWLNTALPGDSTFKPFQPASNPKALNSPPTVPFATSPWTTASTARMESLTSSRRRISQTTAATGGSCHGKRNG